MRRRANLTLETEPSTASVGEAVQRVATAIELLSAIASRLERRAKILRNLPRFAQLEAMLASK